MKSSVFSVHTLIFTSPYSFPKCCLYIFGIEVGACINLGVQSCTNLIKLPSRASLDSSRDECPKIIPCHPVFLTSDRQLMSLCCLALTKDLVLLCWCCLNQLFQAQQMPSLPTLYPLAFLFIIWLLLQGGFVSHHDCPMAIPLAL